MQKVLIRAVCFPHRMKGPLVHEELRKVIYGTHLSERLDAETHYLVAELPDDVGIKDFVEAHIKSIEGVSIAYGLRLEELPAIVSPRMNESGFDGS